MLKMNLVLWYDLYNSRAGETHHTQSFAAQLPRVPACWIKNRRRTKMKLTEDERQALIESIVDDLMYLSHPEDDCASSADTA